MTTGSPVYFDSSTSKFRYGADVEIPQVDVAADSGTLSENTAWSDVPSKSVAGLNTQANALQQRTNWIRANQPVVVTNVAALRLLDKTKIGYAITKGYYTAGDGGAGEYWYDGSDTTSIDNGGSVILSSDGGRWKLVFDGVVNIKLFGASQTLSDNTSRINSAFSYAAQNGLSVYIPTGQYLCGALLFGNQSQSGGSVTPRGLFGDGWSSIFKAIPGFTGTVLSAWGANGVPFSKFAIDGSSVATTSFDTSWKAGSGPSVQNDYSFIRIYGCAGISWVAKDNNDCSFRQITINGVAHNTPCLSLVAPGGLAYLSDCIWNNGYLHIGVQNGKIQNSWGHGILFANASLNYVNLSGCYLYANSYLDCILKSESFSSFQSIHALVSTSTQFISNISVSSYFNLNAYSTLDFFGCQFIGSCSTLLGASSRSDSYSEVKITFQGGSAENVLSLNTMPGFIIQAFGFMNDNTGTCFNSAWSSSFTPVVKGSISSGAATYSNQSGTWYRIFNRVFFELRVAWSGHTGTGNCLISGLPYSQTGGNSSASVGYSGTTFAGIPITLSCAGNTISVFSFSGNHMEVPTSGDIIISGNYEVTA